MGNRGDVCDAYLCVNDVADDVGKLGALDLARLVRINLWWWGRRKNQTKEKKGKGREGV